jgi:hypothetical protein
MFPLLPKGDQTKLLKFFWLKIFYICHWCQWHRWQTLSCEYLREFSKKFETILMEYSGARGKLIHEKNQKQKISWHCPFKLCNEDVNLRLGSGFHFRIRLGNKKVDRDMLSEKTTKNWPMPYLVSTCIENVQAGFALNDWTVAKKLSVITVKISIKELAST